MYPIPGLTGTIEVTIPTPLPPGPPPIYPFPGAVTTAPVIVPLLIIKSTCPPYPQLVLSIIEAVVL